MTRIAAFSDETDGNTWPGRLFGISRPNAHTTGTLRVQTSRDATVPIRATGDNNFCHANTPPLYGDLPSPMAANKHTSNAAPIARRVRAWYDREWNWRAAVAKNRLHLK